MSVEQSDVIDSIFLSEDSRVVLLPVTDHLDWEAETERHMYKLQEKIKTYTGFVKTKELEKLYPEHANKPVVIRIIAKYEYPKGEIYDRFMRYLNEVATEADIRLEMRVVSE